MRVEPCGAALEPEHVPLAQRGHRQVDAPIAVHVRRGDGAAGRRREGPEPERRVESAWSEGADVDPAARERGEHQVAIPVAVEVRREHLFEVGADLEGELGEAEAPAAEVLEGHRLEGSRRRDQEVEVAVVIHVHGDGGHRAVRAPGDLLGQPEVTRSKTAEPADLLR